MPEEEDTYEVTILQPQGEDKVPADELQDLLYTALTLRGTNLHGVLVTELD